MFVEHLSWPVASDQKENALNILSLLHHYMDASGGLVRAFLGWEDGSETHLVSVTFWKGWEDLSRFLASPRASMLTGPGAAATASPSPHHFEIIWEWPAEEADTAAGAWRWLIDEYHVEERQLEQLLENARQSIPKLAEETGFKCAGLWIDKNNKGHVALVTQWSADKHGQLEALVPELSPLGLTRRVSSRLKVSDPRQTSVPSS